MPVEVPDPVDDPSTWPECFVVSPIGQPGTETRRRADAFLRFIVEPVLKDAHFKAVRADMISEPGLVTSQIVRHLVEDPLVIADLTNHNPNVMYELAIRHAAQKPFVQLIDKAQTIPFDVGQQRTIFYDINDLFSVEECKKDLGKHVEMALQPEFVAETPLGRLLDIGNLAGGNRDDLLARLAAKIDSLAARMPIPAVAEMLVGGGIFGAGPQAPAWQVPAWAKEADEYDPQAEARRTIETFVETLKKVPGLYEKWLEGLPKRKAGPQAPT
jgi:hypothetical protein